MTVGGPEIRPEGHSPDLTAAVDRLWETLADDHGLIHELAFDSCLARFVGGGAAEMNRCLPRLVNLLVDGNPSVAQAIEFMEAVTVNSIVGEQPDLVGLFDVWWLETLRLQPGEHHPDFPPTTILGLLARLDSQPETRMVRWLHPWLNELDGPPAAYLADAVLDGLEGEAWRGCDDQRQQVLTWARSEAVVNGLALIGTVHLGDGQLSAVLDRLILD